MSDPLNPSPEVVNQQYGMSAPDWRTRLRNKTQDVLDAAQSNPLMSIMGDFSPVKMLENHMYGDPNQGVDFGPAGKAVSLFSSPELRRNATGRFLDAARHFFGKDYPKTEQALQEFARKYPRIAAHIVPMTATNPPKPDVKGTLSILDESERVMDNTRPMWMNIFNRGAAQPEIRGGKEGLEKAKDLVFHEGTHAAQSLGNKDLPKLYELAEKMMGYHYNPFETSASLAGLKNSLTGLNSFDSRAAYNTMNELKKHATETLRRSNHPRKQEAAREILEILEDRARRGQP